MHTSFLYFGTNPVSSERGGPRLDFSKTDLRMTWTDSRRDVIYAFVTSGV